jgi:predicted transcriptional regulator
MFNRFMQEIVSRKRSYKRMKYRNRIDIIAAILEATASGGVTMSNLFYTSFLGYRRLGSCMRFLIENELIEMYDYDEDNRLYREQQKKADISCRYIIEW